MDTVTVLYMLYMLENVPSPEIVTLVGWGSLIGRQVLLQEENHIGWILKDCAAPTEHTEPFHDSRRRFGDW